METRPRSRGESLTWLLASRKEDMLRVRWAPIASYPSCGVGAEDAAAASRETWNSLESPTDAARTFVAWSRRYITATEPLPKFFEALAKNEQVKYCHFVSERSSYVRW